MVITAPTHPKLQLARTRRWVFYLSAIAFVILAILLATMKESRPSQLLHRKVVLLREATRPEFHFENPDHVPDAKTLITTVLIRPLQLLFTEPIVFSIALMSAVAFGIVFLFTGTLPIAYASYNFTPRQSSLTFIPLAIGPFFGICSRLYEIRTVDRLRRRHEYISPEAKLVGFFIAAPALAVGLWIFAWTIHPAVSSVPFIVSLLALVAVGFAVNEYDYTLALYLAESYTCFAASAYAPVAIMQTLVAAAVPLFGPQMYKGLGVNVASSILAITTTVFCAAPLLFRKYGKTLRMRSPFARRSVPEEQQT